jgi:hypothetical protein
MASSGSPLGMPTGFLRLLEVSWGGFLGQAFWMGSLREDAAARFSAILAKPAYDG